MNPRLLSQPLSPTPAKGSAPRRLRTFGLASLLAFFVLLLWGGTAHADEAVDAGATDTTSTTASADPTATSAPASVPAEDPSPAFAPVDVPADRARVVVAEEPAAVATPVPVLAPAPAPKAEAEAEAAPPVTAPTGRRVPSGFVQATLVRAQAHAAPAVNQCNADTYPTGAGFEASCVVTVENTLGGDGATSSRVTTTSCLAAAGVLPPAGCTTHVATSNTLVTSVTQCNGILAGGSNVTCRVDVINNVPVGTATTGVTVNQCIGSGQGGVSPGGPPTKCDPVAASTSGATVTQCNGSANGGGAPERVQCSVTGGAGALPVTVNQCNGSTAAGSTVTCDVTYTNNFTAAGTLPGGTPTPTPTPVSTPTSSSGGTTSSSTVRSGLGRTTLATSAGASTSSPRSVAGPSSGTGTATSLAATGATNSTLRLLMVALLLLALGALLVIAPRRPALRA